MPSASTFPNAFSLSCMYLFGRGPLRECIPLPWGVAARCANASGHVSLPTDTYLMLPQCDASKAEITTCLEQLAAFKVCTLDPPETRDLCLSEALGPRVTRHQGCEIAYGGRRFHEGLFTGLWSAQDWSTRSMARACRSKCRAHGCSYTCRRPQQASRPSCPPLLLKPPPLQTRPARLSRRLQSSRQMHYRQSWSRTWKPAKCVIRQLRWWAL